MTWQDILVIALLVVGVCGFAFTAIGLLVTRDVFDQIQFLAPASLVGAVSITLAVLVHQGFQQDGVKAILIALLLFWANPILSHATARAARVRHRGQWETTEDENIPAAEEER